MARRRGLLGRRPDGYPRPGSPRLGVAGPCYAPSQVTEGSAAGSRLWFARCARHARRPRSDPRRSAAPRSAVATRHRTVSAGRAAGARPAWEDEDLGISPPGARVPGGTILSAVGAWGPGPETMIGHICGERYRLHGWGVANAASHFGFSARRSINAARWSGRRSRTRLA